MAAPTLYFSRNACSIASLAALEMTGADFTAEWVDMSAPEDSNAAFLAINPRRQVPVLVVGERVIRENSAILTYLHEAHPGAGLLPSDAEGRLRALEWMGYLGGTVHPAFRLIFRPARFVGDDAAAQGALRAETSRFLVRLLEGIARDLGDREWLLGAQSAVDFHLFVFTRWAALVKLTMPAALAAYHARVQALPAMQRALAREAAD